jgi:hypothetical protein
MNKRLMKARVEHNQWLEKRGLLPAQVRARLGKPKLLSTWDAKPMPKPNECNVYTAGIKSIWEKIRLGDEKPATVEAIIAKSKRIAPAYSKGPYQFITNETELQTLGQKT